MPRPLLSKVLSVVCVIFVCGSLSAQAQNFNFQQPPVPAPAAPAPSAPVPAPMPVIPTAPPQIPAAPPPSDSTAAPSETAVVNTEDTGDSDGSLEGLKAKKDEIRKKLDDLNKDVEMTANAFDDYLALLRSGELGSFAFYDVGSLEHAESNLAQSQKNLVYLQKSLKNIDAELAATDPEKSPSAYSNLLKLRSQIVAGIGIAESDISYWGGEVGRLTPLMQKYHALETAYSDAREKRNEVQVEIGKVARQYNEAKAKLGDNKIKADIAAVEDQIKTTDEKQQEVQKLIDQKTEDNKVWPSDDESKQISLTELSPDDGEYMEQVKSDTADLNADTTYQDILVEEQEEAFSELTMANAKLTVLEGADFAGQMAQFGIGMVPGMGGVDVGLSGLRGFTESLGQSIADGVSPADAVKAAMLNAGYTATISVVGNKLTGPADKLAERVIVLSKAGFSKLSTKQVAELGAKGMTFVVVKTSQLVTSAVVDGKGRKLAKNIQDSMENTSSSSSRSASPSYGGYGTSVATRPLVRY